MLLLACAVSTTTHAQRLALNNNLVFDVAGAFSAGVEVRTSQMSSIELYGSLRPWKRGTEKVHKHWTLQAQYRLWPCQVMNGFFWGPYIHGGQFNLANQSVLFGLLKGLEPYRYEGWFVGGGIGIGYQYAIARHWNLGAEIGVGYTYVDYGKYNCEVCGIEKDRGKYHYIGPSRLGLSIIYVF
jgi:hypothetical protein